MGETLEVFFTGKHFCIPNYQRDYSWDVENVDDLIDDIIEAIETKTNHYIGTFILSETDEASTYNVVDGQQRMTTLILLINEAIKTFGSEKDRIIFGDRFIESDERQRLTLLNDNSQYFEALLQGVCEEPVTASQKRLLESYEWINLRVNDLKSNQEVSKQFINTIRNLDVMEFTESNDGKAIRMFQTVNDRGKPLSNMEKAKSLLIYYSNRFLDGEYDDYINNKFGEIFHNYTTIKTAGENFSVDVISSIRFSEDSVMRYHYLAYAKDLYDHGATENDVLDIYLKKSLKPIRTDPDVLRKFLKEYTDDLYAFFYAFAKLCGMLQSYPKIYKIFSILGISTRLYPLIIRLQEMGLVDPENDSNRLLELMEIADFRVYKIWATDPRADMSYLARDAKDLTVEEIQEKLKAFTRYFLGDAEFNRRLIADIHPNPALKHLYIEFEESIFEEGYSVEKLYELNSLSPTVEHIFSKEPTFDFPNLGFENEEDYVSLSNTLGNLTLLEKELNSKCQNRTPDQKMGREFYGSSKFEDARRLSARILNEGVAFQKRHVVDRLEELRIFCMNKWKID